MQSVTVIGIVALVLVGLVLVLGEVIVILMDRVYDYLEKDR